jgi:hypothetical protein
MKRFIQCTASWPQFCVRALIRSQVDPHPGADLEIAGASQHGIHRSQQAGKRVTHDVWRYPFASLFFHVKAERPGEVVAIPILAVLVFRMQHEWFVQTIFVAHELLKLCRQGHGAFFQVFEVDRRGFAQIQTSSLQIEPPRHRFSNFEKAQAGMESAIQNVFQIDAWTFCDQFGHKLGRTKMLARCANGRLYPDLETRVCARQANLDAPIKEAAHRHVISISSLPVARVQSHLVKSADVIRCNAVRSNFAAESSEHSDNINFRIGGSPCPSGTAPVHARQSFLPDKSFPAMIDQQSRRDFGRVPNLRGLTDGGRQIVCVKRNKSSFIIALHAQPVDFPALIDAACKLFILCCHTFTVTFLAAVHGLCKSAQGKTSGAYGARTRNLRRDRAAL